MTTGGWIGVMVAALVIGLVVGFFAARWFFKRQLEKNPPINEAMVRALYQSVGRKPSEADIQRTINAVKRQQR